MQDEVPVGQGAMSAVIRMDEKEIEKICDGVDGIVSIANYNCPGQIVISGETEAVAKAGEALKEAGCKRVIPLKVSGPFHSAMLKGAGDKLAQELTNVEIHDIKIPYVANVTGAFVEDKAEVKELLASQVSNSVRWIQCMESLIASGIDTFVEIGPGKTLSGFAKKINPEVTVYNVEKYEDLAALKEALA